MIGTWISRVLRRGKETRGDMALLDGVRLPDGGLPSSMIVDSPDALEAELARARRYEHALSIVVLSARPLAGGRIGQTPQANGDHALAATLPQVISLLAAAALRDVLRQSDIVCYQPAADRFVLALAESNADEAREALQRIEALFRQRLRLETRAGLARFPEDALTLDDLVATAAGRAPGTDTEPLHGRSSSPAGNGRALGAPDTNGVHHPEGTNGGHPSVMSRHAGVGRGE